MVDFGFSALPWWNWALQGAGLCTAYVGAELNVRQYRTGFIVWTVSNAILATLHAITGLWLLLVLDLLFFRINVIGIRRWHERRPADDVAPGVTTGCQGAGRFLAASLSVPRPSQATRCPASGGPAPGARRIVPREVEITD